MDKDSNVQNLHIANSDRPVSFYSLDVIISVGCCVKSQRGIAFRKWATSILKDYIIKGYVVNEKRLEILNKTIDIQTKMLVSTLDLDKSEVSDIIEVYQMPYHYLMIMIMALYQNLKEQILFIV